MKIKLKVIPVILLLLVCLTGVFFTACSSGENSDQYNNSEKTEIIDNNGENTNPKDDEKPQEPDLIFTGIYFSDAVYTYDGNEKELLVTGDLPENATVTYKQNKGTTAGEYNASATISAKGYADLSLSAKLTIEKADYDMSNVKWEYSAPFIFDGSEKSVVITGLPDGVTVQTYINNKFKDVGTYVASVTLNYDAENYNAISIENLSWQILDNVSGLAGRILKNLVKVPDIWSFFPESLAIENIAYSASTNIDYSSFVEVSSLPQKIIGKQMNVVLDFMLTVETALDYVKQVYGYLNVIEDLFQTYINANPLNFVHYENSAANGKLNFAITLSEDDYFMHVSFASIALELAFLHEKNICYGRIQLTDSTALKYEISDDSVTVAYDVFDIVLTELHFERKNNLITGFLYEYLGTETKNIKTSALIINDGNYTTIISDKRELDDLAIEGYMEVYRNSNGKLIGTEARETIKSIKYETSWFNLWDIPNIKNIKAENSINGINLNTFYINDSGDPIKTKLVGGLSLKTASRRFDIEMKDMFVYVLNPESGKLSKEKIQIPMLFVQNDFLSSFSDDFYSVNKDRGATKNTAITLSLKDSAYLFSEYNSLIDAYLQIKANITYQLIKEYVSKPLYNQIG